MVDESSHYHYFSHETKLVSRNQISPQLHEMTTSINLQPYRHLHKLLTVNYLMGFNGHTQKKNLKERRDALLANFMHLILAFKVSFLQITFTASESVTETRYIQ